MDDEEIKDFRIRDYRKNLEIAEMKFENAKIRIIRMLVSFV